ncbi:MAG: AsmA family protein [Burkholderiales bacterium]|nr:AsmA family protein [Burkholderiales bacterium]
MSVVTGAIGRPEVPRRGLRLASRFALGVAFAVVAALVSHPWWLAPALGSYLSGTSGRDVHFDSVRLGLSPALAPRVVMSGVRIANAPWADTSRPFAVLAEVVFEFAWRRHEDRWLVTRMVLRDGEVDLAREADGRRNWRLRDPEDRGPGHFWFQAIEPHRVAIGFRHEAAELVLRTRATDLAPAEASAEGDPLVNRIDVDGGWRGVAFKGSATTGPELTFFESGRWFPARARLEVAGVRLEAEGRAADLFRGVRIDAATTLSGSSLAGFRPFVGARYAEPRDFRIEGRLRTDDATYALGGARVRVGATDLAGELSWSRRGERRAVSARLNSELTDLADLLWLAGRSPATPATVPKAARAAAAAASPVAARDAFAGARELDADIVFAAKRFRVAAAPMLQSLSLKALLAEGVLAVSDLDVGWGGGHSTGRLGLDLRQHPARSEAQIETRGVRVEALFPASDASRRVTGALRGRAALKASGDNAEALRASVSGTVSAMLIDGTIPSLLDAQMGLEGGKLMRTFFSGSEALALPCAAAVAELNAGRASVRNLVLASANTRITGSGVIDLRDGTIDMALTPEAKRPGLFELQKSIRLSGRLPKPEKSLVDRMEPIKVTDCDAVKP